MELALNRVQWRALILAVLKFEALPAQCRLISCNVSPVNTITLRTTYRLHAHAMLSCVQRNVTHNIQNNRATH
jgi:hypothetical protein